MTYRPTTYCPACGDLPSLYAEVCEPCAEQALRLAREKMKAAGYTRREIEESLEMVE